MNKDKLIRVLIIDDELSIRGSMAGYLDDCGFAVSLSESTEKALRMVSESTYDVAIVDLRLRGLSGDVFIVEAAQICKDLKYIIHTGSVNYALSDELKKIGVKPEHIFRKPLDDLNVIVEAINLLVKEGGISE
ncbi:MAG: response regulator [Candidatus Omnitrophica bacterium]|nr:response regulator [Candidatus Omnitrophota bacterium]MBU1996890.1 response regulator [Candidatus Omnitrophota bacterium]MBU4333631.1 response regulator [Candidatus Omnitrophota bacterium]